MRNLLSTVICGLLAITITACDNTDSAEQMLLDQNATLSTEAAIIGRTATVAADRRRVTLEYASGEVSRLNTQQARIIGTLAESGVIVADLSGMATSAPTTAPNPVTAAPGVTPPATAPAVQVTPFTSTPRPTDIGNQPALIDAVTAQGVGPDDCATNITNQFSTAVQEIYVVATAVNIPDGTQIGSRWQQGELTLWDFGLEFGFIDRACIWFFATPEDFPFAPGDYRVVLTINEQPAVEVAFTIGGTGAPPIGGEAPGS